MQYNPERVYPADDWTERKFREIRDNLRHNAQSAVEATLWSPDQSSALASNRTPVDQDTDLG